MGYIWIMIFLLLTGCSNQQQTQAAGNSPDFSAIYKQRSASREGIGKVYLGREIARVTARIMFRRPDYRYIFL